MANDARAVANFFIGKAKEEQVTLTHLHLQKLVFFAHGWNLAINGTNLIRNAIEAWQHGPVVPAIYHEFKKYGSGEIADYAEEYDLKDRRMRTVMSQFSPDEIAVMNRVWEVYGPAKLKPFQIAELSHQVGGPWHKTKFEQRETVISNEEMRKYFASKLSGSTTAS